jgi:hypothetical protein
MAHFAQIDENNIVQQLLVVSNENCGNLEFPESEPIGQDFINSIGLEGNWKQTSYNSTFRKRYAGLDDVYDESRDAFLPIKPFPSWILNEDTCLWESPIERPNDDKFYDWDEENLTWKEFTTNWEPIV